MTERLSHLPKVTQLLSGTAEIKLRLLENREL